MQIEPSSSAFAKCYARGEPQGRVDHAGSLTSKRRYRPFLKIAGRSAHELSSWKSVEGGAVRGRYSIIGLDPDLIWRTVGGRAEVNRAGRATGAGSFVPCNEGPLAALRAPDRRKAGSRCRRRCPPWRAGVFGYLGYDMVRLMEELPPPNPDPIGIADAILLRPHDRAGVRCDGRHGSRWSTPVRPEKKKAFSAKAALARAPASVSQPSWTRSIGHSIMRPPMGVPARSPCCHAPTPARPNSSAWCAPPRNTSPPAMPFQVVLAQRLRSAV